MDQMTRKLNEKWLCVDTSFSPSHTQIISCDKLQFITLTFFNRSTFSLCPVHFEKINQIILTFTTPWRRRSLTSSVWDTCPSVSGSSSAVGGALKMLERVRRTSIHFHWWHRSLCGVYSHAHPTFKNTQGLRVNANEGDFFQGLPFQSGNLEVFSVVSQELLQVGLADAPYWVDVSAGAVILGEVTCQTNNRLSDLTQKLFSGSSKMVTLRRMEAGNI